MIYSQKMKEFIRKIEGNVVYGNFGTSDGSNIDDRILEEENKNRRIVMASEKLEQLQSEVAENESNIRFNPNEYDDSYELLRNESLGELAFQILRFPEENIKERFGYFKALSRVFEGKLMEEL